MKNKDIREKPPNYWAFFWLTITPFDLYLMNSVLNIEEISNYRESMLRSGYVFYYPDRYDDEE